MAKSTGKDSASRKTERTSVKGGWVKRDSVTGRFLEVGTENGTHRSSPKSVAAASLASEKRGAALKRLADR